MEEVNVEMVAPEGIKLPIEGAAYQRPDASLLQAMVGVSSATASALLHKTGITQTYIR